jgi:type IV pilus assembly protein PilA
MKTVQKGFTLIELMIVVAIIGILAAIAIPQYQDYVTRSRWATAITETASLRTAIAECLQINGGNATVCVTNTNLGFTNALPTATGNGIAIAAPSGNGTGPLGATVEVELGTGSAGPGGCTVMMRGTVAETGVRWTYGHSGSNCSQSRSGFAKGT